MKTIVRDHHDREHVVEIPEGYVQVPAAFAEGWQPHVGDRFLDINELDSNVIVWRKIVDEKDLNGGFRANGVCIFGCLIRKAAETTDTRIPPTGGSSTAPPAKRRLYQLPDGNWIDPRLIVGVMAYRNEHSYAGLEIKPNCVVIHLLDDDTHYIAFSTFEAACDARDAIAAVCK
jgi:hypothetical protein